MSSGGRGGQSADTHMVAVDADTAKLILKHLPGYATLITRDRYFLWSNRIDETLDEETLLAMRVDDAISPDEVDNVIASIERAFETKAPVHYETRGYGHGKLETCYSTVAVPLPTSPERPDRALLLSTDVTARVKAQIALEASEKKFRTLVETGPDFASIIDEDFRMTYANRTADGDTNTEQLTGSHVQDHLREDELDEVMTILRGVFATGEPAQYRSHSRVNDRIYDNKVVPFPNAENGRAQVLVVSRDVTEEIEAREGLLQSQKLDALGQLAGGIAHDFNNLLQVIGSHVALIESDPRLPVDLRRELQSIQQAADQAGDLTKSLLAYARRQPLRPTSVHLGPLVEQNLRMLRRILPSSIELEFEQRASALVLADASALGQVIVNLCVNARDAMNGVGRLRVEVDARNGRALLIVSDTGPGLTADVLAHATEPFFTTKASGAGTGLGLSVVAGIAEQHAGRFSLSNGPHGGAVATFELDALASSASEPADGRPRLVFLAEDDRLVRGVIVRILEKEGYRVVAAAHGVEAIDLIDAMEAPPDVALLDASMPGRSGHEVFHHLRDAWPDVPVIFASGQSEEAILSGVGDAGSPHSSGVFTLMKPFDGSTLIQRIESVLAQIRAATAS